jgi:hypothetical protein
MSSIRDVYLTAAESTLALIEHDRTAELWHEASALEGMSIGSLAAHLARSVLQVKWFLDGKVTGEGYLVTAASYYARLEGTASRASALNQGVEQRSRETAAQGWEALVEVTRSTLTELRSRIPAEPTERRVAVAHCPGEELLLDDYLRTRLVEIAVHIEDLSLSLGISFEAPSEAITAATELLFAAARERNGDRAVLQAMSRRERDITDALRVL